MTKIYAISPTHRRSVIKNHRERTLHDLDAKATLSWTREGDTATAHWRYDATGAHHININEEIVSMISQPKMLRRREHSRSEGMYVKSVHNHETAHGLYTSRDFKGINAECKRLDIPFRDVNLFEDARIEALFRQKRPTAVMKCCDIDHEGNFSVTSETYGVRKFGWLKWDTFALDNPRNFLLSVIKCEGTKKHLDELEDFAKKSTLCAEFVSEKTKSIWGFDEFLKLWRKVAGRGADKRYPTTESLLPLVKEFNDHFPLSPGEDTGRGLGGGDFEESARKAGEEPHAGTKAGTSTPPPIEKPTDERETVKGIHDAKKDEADESNETFNNDHRAVLDENYFDFA